MDFDKSQKSCLSGIYIFDQHYKSRAEQSRDGESSQVKGDKIKIDVHRRHTKFTSHIRFL